MDKRPGMFLKYLPYCYDQVTGKLLTGGSYLFDTLDDAKDYARWTTEDFEVGDPATKFWDQPLWESTTRNTWDVIGAYNFAPMEEHAVGRLQKWMYRGLEDVNALRDAYAAVRTAAQTQEAASIWLLHNPAEKMIAIQMAFRKLEGNDDVSAKKFSECRGS